MFKSIAAAAAALLFLAGTASAETVTLDFDDLAHSESANGHSNPFTYQGFEISSSSTQLPINVWGTTTSENADPGGATIASNSLTLRRIDGKMFDLVSFDVAELGNTGTGAEFRFYIVDARGSFVNSATVAFDDSKGLQTATPWLHMGAVGLSSITVYANEGVQFDNFVFSNVRDAPTAVPEPATWAMLIIGFGIAGTGLRRARFQYLSA